MKLQVQVQGQVQGQVQVQVQVQQKVHVIPISSLPLTHHLPLLPGQEAPQEGMAGVVSGESYRRGRFKRLLNSEQKSLQLSTHHNVLQCTTQLQFLQ